MSKETWPKSSAEISRKPHPEADRIVGNILSSAVKGLERRPPKAQVTDSELQRLINKEAATAQVSASKNLQESRSTAALQTSTTSARPKSANPILRTASAAKLTGPEKSPQFVVRGTGGNHL